MRATGGRKRGNNNHPVPVSELAGNARKRLVEIGQEELDVLFSLRLSGKGRIYGVRDQRALKLLWYDPYHDIYPVQGS